LGAEGTLAFNINVSANLGNAEIRAAQQFYRFGDAQGDEVLMWGLLIDAMEQPNQIIRRKRHFITQVIKGHGCCIVPIQKSARKLSLRMIMHNNFLAASRNSVRLL
jgi:hypothetical protein